jgi:hypothetical protein
MATHILSLDEWSKTTLTVEPVSWWLTGVMRSYSLGCDDRGHVTRDKLDHVHCAQCGARVNVGQECYTVNQYGPPHLTLKSTTVFCSAACCEKHGIDINQRAETA